MVLVMGGSWFIDNHTSDVLSDNEYSVSILDLVLSPLLQDNQKMKVSDLFSILFKIVGKEVNDKYLEEYEESSHYGNSHRRLTPQVLLKIMPTEFVYLV
jgi:UDP-glucose 4-epimerase